MSPFEWWAAHPWRVWWASYVPALGGAFLAQTLEKTGMILFGLGMVVWSASFIQGLRVTWHRSRKKAATIFGLMFLGALANPISRGVSGRDFAKLDSAIVGQILVFGLILAIAVAAEYVVRWVRRIKSSSRSPKPTPST